MADEGVYMYAVSRGLASGELDGVDGLRGQAVRLVEDGALCAVVSDVGLDEFGDEGLRRNLEDLSWLEEVARTHDRVVTRAAHHAVTAPLRLAIICRDDEGVLSRLRDRHDQLVAVLDHVEGRAEWSVKAYHRPPRQEPASSVPAEAETGTAYLRRRRSEAVRTTQDSKAGTRLADQVHHTIMCLAVDGRRLPPQDPRLSGHDGTMTLNGAYLLDGHRAAEIEELVAGIAAEHPEAGVTLSGPWPPYTFATLESA